MKPEQLWRTEGLLQSLKDTLKPAALNHGGYHITNFQFGRDEDPIWAIEKDNKGEILFANQQGISIFNGIDYETIKLECSPLCIKSLPQKNIILVGCKNDFGYLKRKNTGEYKFHSLKNITKKGEFSEIVLTTKYIYFYSPQIILEYHIKSLNFSRAITANDGEVFNGLVEYGDQVFVNIEHVGLVKTGGLKRHILPQTQPISLYTILFSIRLSNNKVLLGTQENKLFVFDGKTMSDFSFAGTKYLNENFIVGGLDYSNDLFFIYTLGGGIMIVDKSSLTIKATINYQSGLIDNEIFTLQKDDQGGVWVSHGLGISRINLLLPVRDYSHYPGLEGNVQDMFEADNSIYVATTQGVFYLSELKSLSEYKKLKQSQKNKTIVEEPSEKIEISIKEPENKAVLIEEPIQEVPKTKKKGIFSRWKEKREKRKANLEQSEEYHEKEQEEIAIQELPDQGKELPTTIPLQPDKSGKGKSIQTKTENEQTHVSRYFAFKRVEGISGKCRQLVATNQGLLVASNTGLYEISDGKTQTILKKTYVNVVIKSSADQVYYIGTDKGLIRIKREGPKWQISNDINPDGFNEPVLSISEDSQQNIWVATSNALFYFIIDKSFKLLRAKTFKLNNEIGTKVSIFQQNGVTYFIQKKHIYFYNNTTGKLEPDKYFLANLPNFTRYLLAEEGLIWFFDETKWNYLGQNAKLKKSQIQLLNLFDFIQTIRTDKHKNLWVADKKNNLYKILNTVEIDTSIRNFKVFLKKIQTENGEQIALNTIFLPSEIKSITCKISVPYFLKPEAIKFQYLIEERMNLWSEWSNSPSFDVLIYPGKFRMKIRAQNFLGEVSESETIIVEAQSPIYQETWFILLSSLLFLILFGLSIFFLIKSREKKLIADKKRLEQKVAERTAEILLQKEQIELRNAEITDSLNYASQIQSAILPPISTLDSIVSDYFIINMPKEIVSGDFHWTTIANNKLIIVAADCTGHGVPGAFLSMLGVAFLNEIVNKLDDLKASIILENLRTRIAKSLNQGNLKKRTDGIDLSLAIVDYGRMELQFSGANNPIYIIRNGKLTEIKGNRNTAGMQILKTEAFQNHIVDIRKSDTIYMFSDGYTDQFGGEHGKKFLSRNFKILLTKISELSLVEQKEVLIEAFNIWKGSYEQIDDILVIGFKI
jgi:serine phosphatase RsbU (regulator of sigma subunit)/ligand-binding sensor domain-containing protein